MKLSASWGQGLSFCLCFSSTYLSHFYLIILLKVVSDDKSMKEELPNDYSELQTPFLNSSSIFPAVSLVTPRNVSILQREMSSSFNPLFLTHKAVLSLSWRLCPLWFRHWDLRAVIRSSFAFGDET